jgi:hypothetical protein
MYCGGGGAAKAGESVETQTKAKTSVCNHDVLIFIAYFSFLVDFYWQC